VDIRRAEVDAYVDTGDEQVDERAEVLSPSGAYRLLIRTYLKEPAFVYTRGTVTRVADGDEICDIKRNHFVFHHAFVTSGGREYLICSHSYLSQSVVDLDGGIVFEAPGDHYDGGAFIWTQIFAAPGGATLAVDGCHWACPYEYRFFDFTDPARAWPALPVDGDEVIDVVDGMAPVWLDANTFECYQVRDGDVAVRTRLRRDGARMVVVERWCSPAEQARRDADAEAAAAIAAWWTEFSTSDPMYLALIAGIREHALPDDGGIPAERRIVKFFRRAEPRAAADLIWDVDVRLAVQLYDTDGRRGEQREFPLTVAGIVAAVSTIAAAFLV